jgi:predicted XRE-type DNA-binding protein
LIVYVLTNKIDHKQYVGQTRWTPALRVAGLLWRARHMPAECPIGTALHEFGRVNFTSHIIASGLTSDEADYLERYLIRTLGTLAPNGYNLSPGGQRNRVMPESTRAKLSRRPVTVEWRERISRACKGRKLSPDRLAKFLSYRQELTPSPGEKNGRAVLTWDLVREIRALYATGKFSQAELANRVGVKQVAISRIIRHTSWKEKED